MPFGLKNVGAMYQRLIDRVFRSQKGRNIKVYVNDILIKFTITNSMIIDIEETIITLRRYELKLNLEKCIFGVRSGCILGYMVI